MRWLFLSYRRTPWASVMMLRQVESPLLRVPEGTYITGHALQ